MVQDAPERPIVTRRRRGRIATNRPGEMRGVADHGHAETVWRAIERAVEIGQIEVGREYSSSEIRALIGRNPGCMDNICLDLAGYRSPVKMAATGRGTWSFGKRFAER